MIPIGVLSVALCVAVTIATFQAFEIRRLRKLIAPFDGDGDGKPGGRR